MNDVQVYAPHSPLLLPKAEELISSYSSDCKSPFGNATERAFLITSIFNFIKNLRYDSFKK